MTTIYSVRKTTCVLLCALAPGGLLTAPAWGQCFQPAQNYPVGFSPLGAVVGDFNGDGKPDLAVADYIPQGRVGILLGNGSGGFGVAQYFATGAGPVAVAVGDFNGDTKPDLAVANQDAGTVSVLLGVGDGTFGESVTYSIDGYPPHVAVGDFNLDGKADLVVAGGGGTSTVSVLLGVGDGTFGAPVTYGVGDTPARVAVGDFNGDAKPDLAATNFNSKSASVLLGNGDGTFPTKEDYSLEFIPGWLTVGDFNGDAKPDLAVSEPFFQGRVGVLLGNGSVGFGDAQYFATGVNISSVAVGDLNGDTKPDLVVTNLFSDAVSVLLGNGEGAFEAPVAYAVGDGPERVVVSDFNADGKPDLAAINQSSGNVSVLLNGAPIPALSGLPVCAGQALTLTVAPTCLASFTAQLSDRTGSFTSPTSLGVVSAGENQVTIPANTAAGSGYRIRLLTGNQPGPASVPFTVSGLNVAIANFPATPGRVCQGEALPVTFSTTGSCPFPVGNVFTVQLSSATGSFSTPTTLGVAQPGTTSFPLPPNLPAGTGYRVRILSSNPAQTSAASAPFRLEGPSLSLTPGVSGAPVCRGNAVTVSFSLPAGSCAFPQGNAFTAQLSSATGSFNNPTALGPVQPGVPNSLTIPAGVSAGTGYRIRVVSSNAVLTSSASIPFRVNACNARLSADWESSGQLVIAPNPVRGSEIRVRVAGLGNPSFSLTSSTGRSVGIGVHTDPESSGGEWVLTPKQRLAPGVYLLQASQGHTRLTTRVLVSD